MSSKNFFTTANQQSKLLQASTPTSIIASRFLQAGDVITCSDQNISPAATPIHTAHPPVAVLYFSAAVVLVAGPRGRCLRYKGTLAMSSWLYTEVRTRIWQFDGGIRCQVILSMQLFGTDQEVIEVVHKLRAFGKKKNDFCLP